MKKLLSLLLLVPLLVFSACSQKPALSVGSSDYGYLPLAGLEWGMTKEEIIEALDLDDQQLIVTDDSVFGYETDQTLFGKKLHAIGLVMVTDGEIDPDMTPRLSEIRFAYLENDSEAFSVLKSALSELYGEPQGYHTLEASGNGSGKILVSTPTPVDNLTYWYSHQTIGNGMNPQAQEHFRSLLLKMQSINHMPLEKEESWEFYKNNAALVNLRLDCREPGTQKSEYGELVFDGLYACYARMLNQRFATDASLSQ